MSDDAQRSSAGGEDEEIDGVVRASYDSSTTNPSTIIVESVAEATGREPTAIEPLYESIDPDALDALLRTKEPSGNTDTVTVSFVFADRHVTVHGTGEIIVRPV